MEPLIDLSLKYVIDQSDDDFALEYIKTVSKPRIEKSILLRAIANAKVGSASKDGEMPDDIDSEEFYASELITYAIIGSTCFNLREVASTISGPRVAERLIAIPCILFESTEKENIEFFFDKSAEFATNYGFKRAFNLSLGVMTEEVLKLFVSVFAYRTARSDSLNTDNLIFGISAQEMRSVNDVAISHINYGGDYLKGYVGL